MNGIFKSFGSEPRRTLIWIGAALGVYWLALIHQLGAQWSVYEQYNYGWAVPFLCLFLLWQRPQTPDPRPQKSGAGAKSPFQFSVFSLQFLIVLLALLYAATRFFHEANPIWRLTSLLWTLEVIGLTLILIRISDFGFRTGDFVFPICFFLVAVPWPSGLENLLVQTFTRLNVSATVELLGGLGIPAMQHANVIEVATGSVGVDEACSGIRSFQATLMIALFFGEFYRLTMIRRIVCVLAGFALSFLFNLARTTLLTAVAAEKGVPAVASWHDPAGVTILVGCFFTLWLTAIWLGRKTKHSTFNIQHPTAREAGSGETAANRERPAGNIEHLTFNIQRPTSSDAGAARPRSALRPPHSALKGSHLTVRRLAIALLGWFLLVEAGTQAWFHWHERTVTGRGAWSVKVAGSGLTETPIPPAISGQFNADEKLQASGKDDTGNFWQLYYFRWFPSQALKNRVAVQLAKTHGPEKCLPAIGMTMKSDLGLITVPAGGRNFVFHQYVFLADDRPLHVFYAVYEDPTGSTVPANRRKSTSSRLAAALAGSRNDGQTYLELAVGGPETPEQARTALQTELEKIIVPRP